jgi:hypothetical protein
MNAITLPLRASAADDTRRLAAGLAVGLLAASIGALYTVFARWGIGHGLQSPDLTVLRFGVAGAWPRAHGGRSRGLVRRDGGAAGRRHCIVVIVSSLIRSSP